MNDRASDCTGRGGEREGEGERERRGLFKCRFSSPSLSLSARGDDRYRGNIGEAERLVQHRASCGVSVYSYRNTFSFLIFGFLKYEVLGDTNKKYSVFHAVLLYLVQ